MGKVRLKLPITVRCWPYRNLISCNLICTLHYSKLRFQYMQGLVTQNLRYISMPELVNDLSIPLLPHLPSDAS